MRCSPEKIPEHVRLFTIARWKACKISLWNHYQTASYVLVNLSGEHCEFNSISLNLTKSCSVFNCS